MLKPSSCKPCPLYNIGQSFSKPKGTGKNGVMIVGEALGHDEAIEGYPFVEYAQAGSKLKECILAGGFNPDDFIRYNVVNCNPPSNSLSGQWYQDGAISNCRKYLLQVFSDYIPAAGKKKVILALGNTAFQTLTGSVQSVLDVSGYPFKAVNLTVDSEPVLVIGSHHPAYIKRGNGELTPLLTEFIKRSVNFAAGKEVKEDEYKAACNFHICGYDDALSYFYFLKDNPRLIIADDIETVESGYVKENERQDLQSTEVSQIQFATNKFDAKIFPNFDPFYQKITKKIFQLPNPRLSWNGWNFDYQILRKKGLEHEIDSLFCDGSNKLFDLMWMFKHFQPTLPRGLQNVACLAGWPFPWKHLFGADMQLYGGADVCSLHFIYQWLVPLMKSLGVFSGKDKNNNGGGGYIEYVHKLQPLLFQASVPNGNGIPVNEQRRVALKDKLIIVRDRINTELQKDIPDEIKNITPKRKLKFKDSETGVEIEHISYGYIREPSEIKKARFEYSNAVKKILSQDRKPTSFERFVRIKYALVHREFKDINRKSGEWEVVHRWCNIEPFKASKDQLVRYIKWKKSDLLNLASDNEKPKEDRVEAKALAKLYEVPKTHKGEETTRKDEIEQLFDKTGDLVLQKTLEHRSLGTNINNYLPNWKPGQDGNVHTTFGYTAPSGQIDSRRPNVLNCSKHTEVGQLFRRIIEAPEDYQFVEFDKKSFHVATMGYVANDPTYIRFSQLDPHSIFTSFIMPKEWGKPVDLSLPDKEILDYCKWIKKKCKTEKESKGDLGVDIRQDQAKPTVLGNQLGLGYKKLFWMNRRSMTGEKQAKYFQAVLASLFPKIEEAKKNIQQIASKQTYLTNEFGYVQWFYDVINWMWNKKANAGRGEWVSRDGQEARLPVAFRVQGCAFGMIKDELFRIMARFSNLGLNDPVSGRPYFSFRNTIHDSLIFMFHRLHLDKCISICLEEMNKPSLKLVNAATGMGGLKVGVEYSIGRNWQNFHKHDNDKCYGQIVDGNGNRLLKCKLEENLEGLREAA